jgi:hypothetical protein
MVVLFRESTYTAYCLNFSETEKFKQHFQFGFLWEKTGADLLGKKINFFSHYVFELVFFLLTANLDFCDSTVDFVLCVSEQDIFSNVTWDSLYKTEMFQGTVYS